MEIRPAIEEDVIGAAGIFAAELAKKPYDKELPLEEAQKIMMGYYHNNVFFVAEKGEEIVGFCIGFKFYWVGGWVLWIAELFVDERYQGKGIGKKLVDHITEHYKEGGISKVELLSHKDSEALGFYSKLGFKDSGYKKLEKWVE